ncbi:ABC transporter ATP-binding protein [Clostridium folliculivorans]|uniref:Nitrate/sulfonate/bicarbonate ABC transporter ATP-binding protein n=1 Tax=Clostridium folliculivorans TaxID=2886038 RepID=A0A9W5Y3P4_9CLOT|nr:ABC transporter ATP-binding protein [Clostridium folliculivorans]GKU25960.1 nitrate/sulfonate/bicarbonate ABC transporter ATP-binding protein [Clostridium folliculivorans]GKU28046.1 nitrate/sulfonate/bicarbonate ABC transporter ATP-binding protein [Clostridium folliculivorans]
MSLVIEGVNKKFISKHKETYTLDNINLTCKKGEFVCILGPSGCGKSTLLNIIAGLESPTEGKISLNGSEIKGVGVDRAVMFQESALFPWLKVIDNVEFGMKIAGVPKKERRERALHYLKMVHLTKFQNSYVHELSGGMRQRVALVRALTLDSEVLLMDEPFAALDSQTKNILQTELQKVWLETKKTIIFITHSVEEAVLLGNRVLVMSANPGKVKREFNIDLARPRKVEDVNLTYIAAQVMEELREEVERIARAEYDNDWSIEKGNVLYSSASDMGTGI